MAEHNPIGAPEGERTSTVGEQVTLHYRVELVFDRSPTLDGQALIEALNTLEVTDLELAHQGDEGVVLRGASLDAGAPPEWRIDPATPWSPQTAEDSISQSWWWPECQASIHSCSWVVAITDAHMVGLDYKERIRRIQQVTAAAVLALQPQGLHWVHSEQFLEPTAFAASVREDGFRSPLPGALHVRFFRLENEGDPSNPGQRDVDAEFLMDTRGLTALGLVDLQCHFRGLDPEDVSHVLYSTGNYLFDQGRVIVPGNTVQGPQPRDAWLVRSGSALGPPEREVLDLDPGFPFAAGDYGEEPVDA